MKNHNSKLNRLTTELFARWRGEDYPGAEQRFQVMLLGRDIAVFVLLPVVAIFLFKTCEAPRASTKRPEANKPISNLNNHSDNSSKSQIIDFRNPRTAGVQSGFARRSPGSLVKVRLMNVVETYSNAPVHVQIVDGGLGRNLLGGTLIGDAISDGNFDRININFKFVRDPNRENIAIPISGRALGLDGTLGLNATKKEGIFARSVFGSTGNASREILGKERWFRF